MVLRLLRLMLMTLLLAAPQAVWAAPPLFKVTGGPGTLYLFGTFHALPQNTAEWLTPALRLALDKADKVVFEIDPATMAGPQAQVIAFEKGLVSDGVTLDRVLPPDLYESVVKAAAGHGMPASGFRQLKPWLAALTLTQMQMAKQGYDQSQGAEMRLYALIDRNKTQVTGLETIEKQIGFFADMPVDQQIDLVRESLSEADGSAKELARMKQAWLSGDDAMLGVTLNDKLKAYPDLYEVLMRQRNQAWLAELRQLLSKRGTALVAVGTAHLIGEDSIVALLSQGGFKVERVQH